LAMPEPYHQGMVRIGPIVALVRAVGRRRDAARSRLLLLAVGIVTGVLAGCSSGPSSQTAEGAAPTSSSGDRTCVSASDGPEVECQLKAGTYRTVGMRPNLRYTVPSPGWSSLNREVAPGNFHLFPPGGSMSGFEAGTTDDITIVTAVVPPGTCTGEPSPDFDHTFDGMVGFLTKNDHIAVSNRSDASVGGWDGTVMDIKFVKQDGCSDGIYADLMIGVDPAHGAFGITPEMAGVRLFLLHNPTSDLPLALLIDDAANGGSDYGDGSDWYDAARSVIDTIIFAT
jgi:hypothetical protein